MLQKDYNGKESLGKSIILKADTLEFIKNNKTIEQKSLDELGLKSYSPAGAGRLITHVIFHPVQKSLNRLVQIDYTVRVQSLSGV